MAYRFQASRTVCCFQSQWWRSATKTPGGSCASRGGIVSAYQLSWALHPSTPHHKHGLRIRYVSSMLLIRASLTPCSVLRLSMITAWMRRTRTSSSAFIILCAYHTFQCRHCQGQGACIHSCYDHPPPQKANCSQDEGADKASSPAASPADNRIREARVSPELLIAC